MGFNSFKAMWEMTDHLKATTTETSVLYALAYIMNGKSAAYFLPPATRGQDPAVPHNRENGPARSQEEGARRLDEAKRDAEILKHLTHPHRADKGS